MTARECPSCGAVLPAGARFCPSCGYATGPRADERRVVTVLFADVVGFTPLSETRDPEHIKNLLDRCFDRLANDIAAYGGRVDKIVGDEIMAVFGAPVAHEDDPERAVRAALQMLRNLVEHGEETGSDVRMRIGVNTGEVLVGSLRAGGDVTALGDVVNIAKRLQTAAQPGQVLVGGTTYEATKECIAYEEVGALTLKGREGPVGAWHARDVLGPPGMRFGRARTPLVGRKSEMALMWHALGTAVAHGRPHFVLLIGDAGMGKTVLVDEAIEMAQAQHDALVLQGRCLPYGEANPWWPIAEALRQACEIDAEDPADVAARKCRASIGSILGTADEGAEASRVADGLLYLMGYEGKLQEVEPSRAREEAARAIQVSLAANARLRPLVITLSELHWADQLVLDLIDSMFDRLRNLPIVVIATARPDLEERWTPKPGRHNLFVLNLDPLDRIEAADVIRKLLGTEPPSELVDLVYERSGGNPLFITELITVMGETGLGLTFDRAEGLELPATLRGLVAARVDSLTREDRALIEDASVVGRSGPVGALMALAEARGEPEPKARLAGLQHRDLLVIADGNYEFKSEMVRDVAYETLTKSERARRHALIADWLAAYAKRTEREEEHLERIAHHYAQAATLVREIGSVAGVPGDELDRALAWLDRAATRAERRETTAVSVHLLGHALDLVGDDRPDLRARFLLGRARGRGGMRDMTGARDDAQAAFDLGVATSDRTLCAKALTVRGEIEQRDGDNEASVATLQEAVDMWRETGDRVGEAEALRLWGFTSIHLGHLVQAEDAITNALHISRDLGDRRGEAWALQNLAWGAFSVGDNDVAEERLTASRQLFQDIGDFGGQAWATGLLAYVWYFKGRLDDAARIAEPSIEYARESGDRWAYGMMLNLLGGVRLWQGKTRQSLEHSRHAQRLFTEMDDVMGLLLSSVQLAWACILTGQRDEGLATAMKYAEDLSSGAFAGGLGGVLAASQFHTLVGESAAAIDLLANHPGPGADTDLDTTRALAYFVEGRSAEAYDVAADVWATDPQETSELANYGCVFALTAAAAGHPDEAIAAAEKVIAAGGSYVDRIRAHLSHAFAASQIGHDSEVRTELEAAHEIVDASEDEVHKALVRLAEATIASTRGADLAPLAEPINNARDRLEVLGVGWRKWESAFRLAATGGKASESVVGPATP